jgi:hypothetical protein
LRFGSHFSRGLERPTKDRILSVFAQCHQAVAVIAVDLKPVTDSADLLSKDARAARTPNLDRFVQDEALDEGRASQMVVMKG